jgi:hypothetical protein
VTSAAFPASPPVVPVGSGALARPASVRLAVASSLGPASSDAFADPDAAAGGLLRGGPFHMSGELLLHAAATKNEQAVNSARGASDVQRFMGGQT